MPCQLPADCLNEIFEYLEEKVDLYSCLLVNRLWCEVSVQILWTSIQNYNTLIACLPNESRELLYKNQIIVSTPTSKPLLFNYVAFIKSLSIEEICCKITGLLKDCHMNLERFYDNRNILVIQEIFKMFMNQASLKTLYFYNSTYSSNIPFTTYPGAIDCLRNLSELRCDSNIYSEFFCQISQICHNLLSLEIIIGNVIPNGLTDLFSIRQNLKHLSIFDYSSNNNLTKIIPSIAKLANNLNKLHIGIGNDYPPLLFLAKFTNLQELVLSFYYNHYENFKTLQYVAFPQLQIFKI